MAWHHVADETTDAPEHALESWTDRYMRSRLHVGKRLTGRVVTKTFSVWRCGLCRALAVTKQGDRPTGDCGKCKARG